MSWVDDVLHEFGRTLGMRRLAFNARGVARMTMERMGSLGIERLPGELLVYMVRRVPASEGRILRRALTLCHYNEGHPFVLQAGLKGDEHLVFLVRIPEREFSVQTVEQSIELLDRLHGSVA